MKHKIISDGQIYVKEKKNIASRWVFISATGIETYDTLQPECRCENQDHAERIVKYRLGLVV